MVNLEEARRFCDSIPAKDKVKKKPKNRFKYVGLAIGAALIAFLIGFNLILPLFNHKEDIDIINVDTKIINPEFLGDEQNNSEAFYTIQPPSNNGFGVKNINVVNWSYFWKLFNKYSAWQLEAWHPQLNEWVTEYNGENLNNWLTITKTRNSSNASEKIALTVENNALIDTYFRFKFGIDLRVKNYVNKTSNYEYVLTYPANLTTDYQVFFNWSDLKPDMQNGKLAVNHGIKTIQGRDIFYFVIRGLQKLPAGNSYTIDPDFGITSTTGYSAKTKRTVYLLGTRATADVSGTATSLSVYGYSDGGTGAQIGVAVYDCDNSYSLEGYASSVDASSMTSEDWHTIDLDTTCTITSGTTYYLLFWAKTAAWTYWGKTEGSDSMYEYDADPYNWPDPCPNDSSSTKKAVYCTVSTAPAETWHNPFYWNFDYTADMGTNYTNITVNPSDTEDNLYFNTTSQTVYDINASQQTSGICAINITNDGDIPINITLRLNDTIGEDIHLKYSTTFNPPANTSNNEGGWTENNPTTTNIESYTNWLLRLPSHRILNYVNGRYWLFYGNVTSGGEYNRSVISSTDGVTWSDSTNICNLSTNYGAADFDVVVEDNGDFHYIQSYITYDTVTQYPSYRKGNLGSDGVITWYGDETIIRTWEYCEDPSINLDSDGYPYIVVENRTAEELGPVVFKSTTKNGEFTMADGYPLMLAEKSYYPGIMLPLTNNKMYCVYYYSLKDGGGGDIYGRLYNGTGWEAEVKLADNSTNNQYFIKGGAVSINDDVHFIYFSEDNRIIHVFRNGTTGTVTETNVTSFDTDIDTISPTITKTNNNDLFCFWYLNYPDTNSGYHSGGDTNTKLSEYAVVTLHEDIEGYKITAPADGWIDYINAYLCYKDETAAATCALYYESNDTFIADTEEKTITNAYDSFEWYRFNFTNPVYVKGGTEYIICVYGDSGAGTSKTLYVKTKSGGSGGRKVDDANDYPNFPASTSFSDVAPPMITCNYTSYNHSFVYKQFYHNNETWNDTPNYWFRDTNTTDSNTIGGGIFVSNYEEQSNKILLAYVRGNQEDISVPSSSFYGVNISVLNITASGYYCDSEITTTNTQVITDLAAGSSQCVYLWADFDNTTYWGDIVRLLNITSSNGTGYSYNEGYNSTSSYYDIDLTFSITEPTPPPSYDWHNPFYWNFDYSNVSTFNQGFYWNFDYSNTSTFNQGFYWNFDYSNTATYQQGFYWNFDYSNTSTFKNPYYWNFDYSNVSTYQQGFYWNFDYSNTVTYNNPYYWNFDYSNSSIATFNNPYYWNFDYSNVSTFNQGFYWNFDYSNTSTFNQGFYWNFDYSNTATYQQGFYWNFDYSYNNHSQQGFYWNFDYSNSTPTTYILISNIYPANNSNNIPLQPNVYATINQTNGQTMNISIYYGSNLDNTNTLLENFTNVNNGTQTTLFYTVTSRSTNYYWRINVDDGDTETNQTLTFKSEFEDAAGFYPVNNNSYALIGLLGLVGLIAVLWQRKKKGGEEEDEGVVYYVDR